MCLGGTSYVNIGVIAKKSEMTLKTPKKHQKRANVSTKSTLLTLFEVFW
jgi:hypothetical protein